MRSERYSFKRLNMTVLVSGENNYAGARYVKSTREPRLVSLMICVMPNVLHSAFFQCTSVLL